ncbi:MAG TPA: hypothetical protein VFP91_22585 [Vicinamibacterales bacterium]|nr:hypothetical protein [Vicinamibacterales bacterium]
MAALSVAGCSGKCGGGDTTGSVPAAAPPTVTAIDPPSGLPHTVVAIQGTSLEDATIIWDSDTTPTPIPGGYQGAYMFSVPPTAAPGVHKLLVRNSTGDSAPVSFTVIATTATFPKPRVDAVTLVGATFDGAGHVTATLYVQGANIDVGAVVVIGGTEVATTAHKALMSSDPPGVPAVDIGYHISHYLSTVAIAGTRNVGDMLSIKVRNLDMQEPDDAVMYPLPTDEMSMDSDGDGLPDSWEVGGHTGVDLAALGANPYRRDILLEVDVMRAVSGTAAGLHNPPSAAVFAAAQAMFANAPFLNVSGASGINLILDTSETIDYVSIVCFDRGTYPPTCDDDPSASTARFSSLKKIHFDDDEHHTVHRDHIFHYAIWGAAMDADDIPGISDNGDDVLISFDNWGTAASKPGYKQNERSKLEELVHELGHDLGLYHGGAKDGDHCYLPNHWSVMSYTWDKRTMFTDGFRMDHATCLPIYYQGGGTETSGAAPMTPNIIADYSSGIGRPLVEGTPAMMCGKPIMWQRDNDANADDCLGLANTGTIKDVADWRLLDFHGIVTNGTLVVHPEPH